MMNFLLFLKIIIPLSGWELLYSSLNDWSFTNNEWKQNDQITYISSQTCPTNQISLLCLDNTNSQGYKYISGLPPHYELKIVADLYYVDGISNYNGEVVLDSVSIDLITSTIGLSMGSYSNQCAHDIKTAQGSILHNSYDVTIQIQISAVTPSFQFCFRNVQLLIKKCHFTCLLCNGSLINNCLDCLDGTTPSMQGTCPICNKQTTQFYTTSTGCAFYCPRDNYLADENKICQFDNRVSDLRTSFFWAINVVPATYDWDLYNNGIQQSQRYFTCNGYSFIGMYFKEEYIENQYFFASTIRQIRIRISHHMFNIWAEYSQIELLMDGVQVSLIYMKDGIFRTIKNNIIQSQNRQCSNLVTNKNYYFLKTEQIIKITSLNPTFTFKSSQDLWSVRDIQIDIIVCSLYCSTCLDDQNCSVCEASYHLYKGQCISSCPEYSTVSGGNCIDFDEETQYTSYLIKAFYSFDSQDTETSLFNLISSFGTNFQKGNSIYFSYLKDRRIFGGALVWLHAKFGNTYTIPQPHYAVRVRMVVILGDDFGNGQFQYQFESDLIVTLTKTSSTSTSHSQQWGDTYDEYFYQVNTLVPHTASSFSITVECIGGTSKAIHQAFCGISNYFVTVLECQTFCDACTDISTCSSWSTTTANFDPITHQCFPGYSTDISSKTCVADPVCGNGILEINEQCDDGNFVQADGCFNCQYSCSSFYPNCVQVSQVTCGLGFYLNQFDNICYPLCGDGIIVAQEQCDDQNILPFDGCHRCMYSCQDGCSECRNGECYKCLTGWSQQNGMCQPICGDGIVRGQEICDDANSYQIVDTCQSNICSYICPNNCQSCSLGVCYQCDGGFKLNTLVNKCETVCGDLNITEFEECDDGNLVPYDGCYQCMFQCQNSCSDCRFGKCYKCKSGWEWKSQAFRCEPICGDGLRVEIEVCDDRIYQLGDVCLACQFECPDYCITCEYGVCKVCDTGYQLDKIRNDCQPICGDQLIVSNEECDDGNLIPQDGCHECLYQCQDSCLECLQGKCYRCESGWEWISQTFRCEPICGDGLRVEIEVCDDLIYQLGDVCLACKFGCPGNCILCDYGVCKECDFGYQLHQARNDCLPICGDTIIVSNEECDDGNIIPQDGCHECQYQCQDSCLKCLLGQCYRCGSGWEWKSQTFRCEPICGDGLRVEIEVCDDFNYQLGDVCLACQFQCPSYCIACDYGVCKLCDIGYQLDITRNDCQPICGDQLIVQDEECDDGNLIPQDGCHECSYQCQNSCLECREGMCYRCEQGWEWISQTFRCEPICGDGLRVDIEVCDDRIYQLSDVCLTCKFNCPDNCTLCDYGVCKECDFGYELDHAKNDCKPICGDKIIVSNEECDDGNLFPFDGCFECQFQCEQPCTDCLYGICYQCNTLGYQFIDNHCLSICGDSLIIGNEKCDDGNLIPYDGCFECQFTCEQSCTDCLNGICLQCDLGFELISNNCLPICGDYLIRGDEECDDGNLIPYDGCYECSYQCQLECTDCRLGICYDCDTIGWELQINSGISECYPICGDGRITGNEECDDPDDSGCQDCKYICHEQCLDCNWGICFTCAPGWYNIDSQCYSFCGDGYKVGNEECDDFNLVDLDGCSSNCEIEASQACEISNHQSVCSHIVVPSFKLEHEFIQSATQYIKIEFTNEMRKYCDFTFNIEINGCEDNSYAIQNTSLVPAQFNKLQNVTELIEINFNSSCVRPKVTISLNNTQCLANFYKQQVYPPTDQIIIQQINLISDYSRDKAILMGEVNNYMFYAFLGLMGLSLFTGGLDLMWNMLDLLQYFSYMRLINVSFPKNLDLYFESFEQVSIQPLFNIIKLNYLLNLLTEEFEMPQIECEYKFSELNGLFIANIKSVLFVLIVSFSIHFIQKVIFLQLNKISLSTILQLRLSHANFFISIIKTLYIQIKSFYTSLLLRILMGSAYDINFSIFLQLSNFNLQTQFLAFNSIFSIITLLGYILIVFSFYQYKGNKYPPLFEGINLKSHWGREFNCVQSLKKTIFIFFLVFLPAEPIIQCLLISMLCFFNIIYIYLSKPLKNQYEYYKVLFGESIFCFCSLNFIVYEIYVSIKQVFTDYLYQIFGWVQIVLISLVLSICLGIDLKQQINLIILQIQKQRKNKFENINQSNQLFVEVNHQQNRQ